MDAYQIVSEAVSSRSVKTGARLAVNKMHDRRSKKRLPKSKIRKNYNKVKSKRKKIKVSKDIAHASDNAAMSVYKSRKSNDE